MMIPSHLVKAYIHRIGKRPVVDESTKYDVRRIRSALDQYATFGPSL